MRALLRYLRSVPCKLMLCPHRTVYDDPDAIYGECVKCGHRAGEVTREELRRYGERMDAAERYIVARGRL